MSSEKEAKSSGTRRKARECALQMLFAGDLVGPEKFSATRYWGQLGYDEIFRGATPLVSSFRDQIDKFEKTAADLRAWLKKAEPFEKTNSRFDKVKDLTRASDTLRKQYQNFIDGVVEDRERPAEPIFEQISGIRVTFDRLKNDIDHSVVGAARSRLTSEERSHLADLMEHGYQILDRMANEILPQIEKMIEMVRPARVFADRLALGTLSQVGAIDDRIRTRAEHWRIERMAIVDRNVLRLAVYEFLYEDTPHTVVINEALEIARRFSTFEATQFINGILDAIKLDLEKAASKPDEKSRASSR